MPYGMRPFSSRPARRYRYAPGGYGYFYESKRDNARAAAVALPFLIAWAISPLLLWGVLGSIFLVGVLDPLIKRERAARRRDLAAAARAQKAMRTTHRSSRREPPSRELLLRCWELSRDSLEGKILLGSLLGDVESVAQSALAALAVFFRDVIHLWGVVITAWTYATPIFYPEEVLMRGHHWMIYFNPIYHVVHFSRLVLNGSVPPATEFAACAIFAVLSIVAGTLVFRSLKNKFALAL